MKTYLSDIIPKVKRFSDKLDNISLLKSAHWVVLNESTDTQTIYIFRDDKQLLISTNGRIAKGSWEYIGHNSLIIDHDGESLLFQMGYFDKNILALKMNSNDEYVLLINQNNDAHIYNSLSDVHKYLTNRYFSSNPKYITDVIHKEERSLEPVKIKDPTVTCINCSYFSFSGILDRYKGKCSLHLETTYTNWSCDNFKMK